MLREKINRHYTSISYIIIIITIICTPNASFNFYVQVHASDGIKGICRWQLIEFIISLNQFCFNYSLQIFAASTPAKTLAVVPLSRLERATSAYADLDTGGPTVNLVMPHLTLFYLHCLSRWLWLHVWLFVCTRIKPQYPVSVIIGGWVISLQLTPKPE